MAKRDWQLEMYGEWIIWQCWLSVLGSSLTLIVIPHCQHPEDKGTEGCSEESSPVVPHGKERRCDLNTKQHSCHNTADRQQTTLLKAGGIQGNVTVVDVIWRYLQWPAMITMCLDLPPIGAAKQQPTPTAQAADSISVFLSSFCQINEKTEYMQILFQTTVGVAFCRQPRNRVITLTDTWQWHAEQGIAMNTIKKWTNTALSFTIRYLWERFLLRPGRMKSSGL